MGNIMYDNVRGILYETWLDYVSHILGYDAEFEHGREPEEMWLQGYSVEEYVQYLEEKEDED